MTYANDNSQSQTNLLLQSIFSGQLISRLLSGTIEELHARISSMPEQLHCLRSRYDEIQSEVASSRASQLTLLDASSKQMEALSHALGTELNHLVQETEQRAIDLFQLQFLPYRTNKVKKLNCSHSVSYTFCCRETLYPSPEQQLL